MLTAHTTRRSTVLLECVPGNNSRHTLMEYDNSRPTQRSSTWRTQRRTAAVLCPVMS
ncbi:hypothetical protein M404DRAFT_997667 [Pisolithus tinctorius Marx 270]|uniref:Uncharacterized protein n=1 Tax=Pisolithus tinctorius Marx 270 TaxID=870435 RepID=A0A0C3KEF8_PISTI|nr:hypothetical protein M404DRAFT_997667 [Pisolithus tinctorius Marx 270]